MNMNAGTNGTYRRILNGTKRTANGNAPPRQCIPQEQRASAGMSGNEQQQA